MNDQNPNMDDFFRNLFGSGSGQNNQNNQNTPNPFDILGGLLGGLGGQPMPTGGGGDLLGMLENILSENMKGANRSTQPPISEDEVKKFSEQLKNLDNEKVEDILRKQSQNNENPTNDLEEMLNTFLQNPPFSQGGTGKTSSSYMQEKMREEAKKNHPSQGGKSKSKNRIVSARVTHREETTHVEVVTQGVDPEQLTSVSLDSQGRLGLIIIREENSPVDDAVFFATKTNVDKDEFTINLNTPDGTVLVEEGSSYTFKDGILNVVLSRKNRSFSISEKGQEEKSSIVENPSDVDDGSDGFFIL